MQTLDNLIKNIKRPAQGANSSYNKQSTLWWTNSIIFRAHGAIF